MTGMCGEATVWVTKYALTKGVAVKTGDVFEGWLTYEHKKNVNMPEGHIWQDDYAHTEQEAVTQVEKKIAAEIKSAERKLAKLKALDARLLVKKCSGKF